MRAVPNHPVAASLLAGALLAAPAALAQEIHFTKIADEFTPVPGMPGQLFEDAGGDDCRAFGPAAEAPALSEGRVLFHAFQSPGSERGLYLWEDGALSVVVDTTTPVPGEASTYSSLDESPTLIGPAIGFRANFDAGRSGYFQWEGGISTLVIAEGDPSPSTSGASMMYLYYSPSAGPSQLAFIAQDDAADQVEGIYFWDGSTITVVADESTEAPGQPGVTFENFDALATDLEGGRLVFWGQTADMTGLYLWDGASLELIADDSTPVPGRPMQTFAYLEAAAPSFDGETVVFIGEDRPGDGSFSFFGIYAWNAGTLSAVVTEDTPLPGGGTVGGGIGNVSVSGGRVLFEVDCETLYLVEDGTPRRVLGIGDMLDGRPVEAVWGGRQALDGRRFAFNVAFGDGGDQDAVYLAEIEAPDPVLAVPTLSQWGLGLLALLLALAAAARLGRRRPVAG